MTETLTFTQKLRDCSDVPLVGGKAANLGRLITAGFPVPDGFVVTTRAYAYAHPSSVNGNPMELPGEVAQQVLAAYREMGGGTVAVRSSATAEDMGDASMAGQYETFLDVEGEQDLLDAIRRCWVSLDAPRTRAYLAEHGIDLSRVNMAVVVQKLIPADVAGVLFTANPNANGKGHLEMLLEASWGLGESIVAGHVQPDILRLEHATGRVLSATISEKRVELTAGTREQRPVEASRRNLPCLGGRDVHRLWQLGKRTAQYFGTPQDIEWAIAKGELFLIQSRPITTRQQAEACDQILRSTRKHLRAELAAGRGPWVLHNLAETLPHPTPLTWSIIQRFMSGAGGFGTMYRKAGFEPSPAVLRDGFLDLVAGRIYMDAARAPEMFFMDFPFAYDLEQLKSRPDASQVPPTVPRGSIVARLRAARKLAAVNERLKELSIKLDRQLRDTLFPEIGAYVAANKPMDLHSLSVNWLVELWQEHEKLVLETFAPQLLLPSLISGMAMEQLRRFLEEHFWDEDADALAQLVSSGGEPNRTLVADARLYDVAKETYPLATWLTEHGHRAAGEFDLAAPRWRERPDTAREMAMRLASGEGPMERRRQTTDKVLAKVETLRSRLNTPDQRRLDQHIELARRYVMFREDGKDLLMLGYDLLRDLALEAGRRLDISDDVFYLTREELFDALRVGFAPHHVIEERKQVHQAESKLSLPRVIDAAAVDELGEIPEPKAPSSGGHKAFAVSSGEASGPARILRSPTTAQDLGHGYILVCPSTDPSWTPLFVNAAGLVLECGGALSHGAVVAREMGLPAVVLQDATHLFQEGEEIQIDANAGWVGRATDIATQQSQIEIAEDNLSIPRMLIPPPPGGKERLAGKLRNWFALLWTFYLLAFFLLPSRWVQLPSIHAMDLLLWPIVRLLGKPGAVAVIAIGIAVITLALQKLLTDNHRLLEAKRRAAALKKQAEALPKDSPRRAALLQPVGAVQVRTLLAAMVPIGLLLGPMVMPLVWFSQRVDPSAWNAAPGSAVQIVAMVDGEWTEPVQIAVPQSIVIDPSTPPERSLPRLRQTLERLLSLYRQPHVDPQHPWEIQAAPDLAREATADDLQAYLDEGIPPQGITWLVRAPEELAGRFAVIASTPGHAPMSVTVVLGDKYPPTAPAAIGAAGSPIRELRVVYPRPIQEPVFLRPLSRLSSMEHIPFAASLARIDIGWLGLYILVYLPSVLLARNVLKVA